MLRKKHTLVVTFAVCTVALVALVALGAPQKSVERPFKIDGYLTATLNATTGAGIGVDWGEATHVGRYDNAMTLQFVPPDGMIGSGTLTAANGDKLFWTRVDHVFTFTGGTGRFEGATGGFVITHPPAVTTPGADNTIVASHPYSGVGTITY